MVFKRGKRKKQKGNTDQDKPERISNRLDRKLIAESRQLPKRRRQIVVLVVLVVIAGVTATVLVGRNKPQPPVPPSNDDPLAGQEADWQPIFHYNPDNPEGQ